MKKIMIIAGDKSGDVYGGMLAKELILRDKDLQIFSCGGQNLADHSCQLVDLISHSVMGLVEVLGSLPKIIRLFNQIYDQIKKINPDLVILIDFPDFNLRLAKKINNQWPVFYYVSPTVWAWRKNRIKLIKQYVRSMIVLFKFEQEFYKKEGLAVEYFGHPLLEIIKKQDLPAEKIITFMPGSRISELKNLLPIIEQTKNILAKSLTDYSFKIIRPQNLDPAVYRGLGCTIDLVDRDLTQIQQSSFIVACSGTATLEIAILGVPHLIIYKANQLTWEIGKRLVNLKYLGLANIISNKKIVEELLQENATPEKISAYVLNALTNPVKYQELKNNLADISLKLQPPNPTAQITSHIVDFLKR